MSPSSLTHFVSLISRKQLGILRRRMPQIPQRLQFQALKCVLQGVLIKHEFPS